MAKRKKKKETKKGFAHSTELYGVLLVLAAILGIGRYGPVGNMIASFAIFLVGVLYNPLLVVLLILGAFLIINRSWPNLFTTKMLGIYLLLIGVLVLMHENFILQNDSNAVKVFSETTNQLINSFSDVMKGARPNAIGGGIIGCTFGVLFMMLFSYRGMQIIAWTLIIIGFSLFTGFSIVDFVKDKASKAKEKFPKRDKNKEGEPDSKKPIITGNEEPAMGEIKDDDKKIVISSIDELTKAKVNEEVTDNNDVSDEDKEAQKLASESQAKIDEANAAKAAEEAKGYETGITYTFNEYEIAAYVVGTINVHIPFDDIKYLLKADGLLASLLD